MVLSELLHWLGVPGSIVLVLSAGLTVYHGRHLLALGAMLGTWLRFGGVLVLLTAIAYSGLVPGVNLNIDLGKLFEFIVWLWSVLPIPSLGELWRWLPL